LQRTIEKALLEWKTSLDRLPIILRGARQVGKSYIVEKLGKEHFENVVIANFEEEKRLSLCFDTLLPAEIISKLEALLAARILPRKTLLFLDEIQECPQAILALRYFKEKMPELHVIAAGSLLEFVLNEIEFSFPVGRVQFMYLKPLSFQEFLFNLGQEKLLDRLNKITLENPLEPLFHDHLLQFVRQYLLVGGMPAVVNLFSKKSSYLECQRRQKAIMQTYYNDFSKYAGKVQHKYLQKIFEKVPLLIGQHFKYSSIDPEIRSEIIKIALEQLKWVGLIQRIFSNNASGIPLKSQKKENKFKLLFLDIGLLQAATLIDYAAIFEENILQINAGAIAEQLVGQELLAYGDVYEDQELYFWERDKKTSIAEVDYVLQQGSQIIPIEVKAGKTGRLKSLQQFMEEKKAPFGIRISQNPLSFEKNILSIPLYMIFEIPRLLKELRTKIHTNP